MKPIDDAAKDLSRFRGWTAQLWDYSVSHKRCRIRFHSADSHDVYLVLYLCERVNAPKSWDVAHPRCTQRGEEVVFSDDGVEIRCRHVALVNELKDP